MSKQQIEQLKQNFQDFKIEFEENLEVAHWLEQIVPQVQKALAQLPDKNKILAIKRDKLFLEFLEMINSNIFLEFPDELDEIKFIAKSIGA